MWLKRYEYYYKSPGIIIAEERERIIVLAQKTGSKICSEKVEIHFKLYHDSRFDDSGRKKTLRDSRFARPT